MSYQPDIVEVILDRNGKEETITVKVDQRDLAAWEGCDVNIPDRAQLYTATRWMAWHAARRAGQIGRDATWEKFNEDLCLKASVVNAEPAAAEEDDDGPLAV